MLRLLTLLFLSFVTATQPLSAQTVTQTIKGQVLDKDSEIPLIGATIELLSINPIKGTTTDVDGHFALKDVTVGRHILRVSYLGYNSTTIPEILVTAGKEVVLQLTLEEQIIKLDEVVVTAKTEKDKALNDMAAISARSFTLEEVTRYSGGRNDASRMAANFAGVVINDDSRNDLVIRGNSPTGVLWRLEGVDIPNPNHFSTLGTTGGPVSALNTNLLSNSDFLTSAFPAEYGNANAGVFDIHFRNGNKDKFEMTAQLAAFSGLELMAEGPLGNRSKGSYIVSFRNSFVQLADATGVNIGTNAIPNYRDLTFKLDFGYGKLGRFTLFGLGGTSDIDFLADEIDENDFFANENQNSFAESKIGIIGLNHRYILNDQTYLRTSLAFSSAQNQFTVDDILEDETEQRSLEGDDTNSRFTISSYLNKKVNPKLTLRSGVKAEIFLLNVFFRELQNNEWVALRDFEGALPLYQAFAQSKYRFTDKLSLNAGLHAQYLSYNDDIVLEPRVSLSWKLSNAQTLTAGAGIHHQMLPLPLYLLELPTPNGSSIQTNKQVDFLESRHYVLAYDYKLSTDWRVKVETYYQDLVKVPVEAFPSGFSVLNVGDDFGFPEVHNLQNTGKGRNYGVELTVEKFLSKGYYGLLTASLFDSEYQGSDGIWRNTAFNNGYVFNVLAGREIPIGKAKRNALTFDMKFTTAGGRYYTPIDLDASRAAGREIGQAGAEYLQRYDPYLRLDVKFGFRLNSNKRNFSQQFYLDFQNVTNRQNVFLRRYDELSGEINTVYQIGFFPDILYRIQF